MDCMRDSWYEIIIDMSISRVYEVVFEKIYEDSTDEEWNQVQAR